MCQDKNCHICSTFVVICDTEKCVFGTFTSEKEAIRWAKIWSHWPEGSWRVVNLYPVSIG